MLSARIKQMCARLPNSAMAPSINHSVVFGHTHTMYAERHNGVLFFNWKILEINGSNAAASFKVIR